MPFEAIVHAPALRVGARLNVAAADQTEGMTPERLGAGAEVRLRLGCCSPRHAFGRITVYAAESASAVLTVGAESWTLRRSSGAGVSVPGLLSEVWYVAAKVEESASPTDNSIAHSGCRSSPEG